MPSGVQFQVIVSGTPWISCTSWILIQSEINSSMWVAEATCPLKESIQLLIRSSCCTDLFFLLASYKRLGAKYLGACPSNQLLCHNRAFASSPKLIVVEELNNRQSMPLQGRSIPTQGLESSVQSCHNQCNLRARPNLLRSGTPKPPRYLGRVTVGQLTRQWPPFAFFSPFHRKDLLILSIFFYAHAARRNTVR